MKSYVKMFIFFITAATLLPIMLSAATANVKTNTSNTSQITQSEDESQSVSADVTVQAFDEIRVYNAKKDAVETVDLETLTARVLYAEMPASFNIEALKAQAVAIRTYIIYAITNPIGDGVHDDDVDICTDYRHCVAYRTYEDAVEAYGVITAEDTYCVMLEATSATAGEYIVYNGAPINAVFHAASAGRTESCLNIWGADVPYLQSVETPEAEREYEEKRSFLPSELKSLLEPEGIEPLYNPTTWIGELKYNDSGRVASVEICNTVISAKKIRSLLELRSTDFTIEYVDGYFTFTTVGYGHGVGLSQYGANTLAEAGKNYREIIAHYYTNTTVNYMSPTA